MFLDVESFDCLILSNRVKCWHFALFGSDERVCSWAINISPLRGGFFPTDSASFTSTLA